MTLSAQEHRLVSLIGYDEIHSIKRGHTITTFDPEYKEEFVESDKEFDLTIEGTKDGTKCGSWLPLACIRRLTMWTSPEIAVETDYPSMAQQGDWSGVRDTREEKLWEIFERFVLAAL